MNKPMNESEELQRHIQHTYTLKLWEMGEVFENADNLKPKWIDCLKFFRFLGETAHDPTANTLEIRVARQKKVAVSLFRAGWYDVAWEYSIYGGIIWLVVGPSVVGYFLWLVKTVPRGKDKLWELATLVLILALALPPVLAVCDLALGWSVGASMSDSRKLE